MSNGAGIRFGPLGDRTCHLCIDMQVLYDSATEWHVPWMRGVLPAVLRLAEAHAKQTAFTRFLPPEHPDQMPGTWRRYYRRWQQMTSQQIDPLLLELLPELRLLTPPAAVIDKRHYSPFLEAALPGL